MIKIQFEEAVQYLGKNSTDLWPVSHRRQARWYWWCIIVGEQKSAKYLSLSFFASLSPRLHVAKLCRTQHTKFLMQRVVCSITVQRVVCVL